MIAWVVVLAAAPAPACDVADAGVNVQTPAPGAVDVPTNTLIVIHGWGIGVANGEATLAVTAGRENVPGDAEGFTWFDEGADELVVFRPDAGELPAEAEIQVSVPDRRGGELALWSFTTGDAALNVARPVDPVIELRAHDAVDATECVGEDWAVVSMRVSPSEAPADSGDSWILLRQGPPGAVDEAIGLLGPALDGGTTPMMLGAPDVEADVVCVTATQLGSYWPTVTSEPSCIDRTEGQGSGCQHGVPAGGLLSLLLMALLGTARRANRRD